MRIADVRLRVDEQPASPEPAAGAAPSAVDSPAPDSPARGRSVVEGAAPECPVDDRAVADHVSLDRAAREHVAGMQIRREQHLLPIPLQRQRAEQVQAPLHQLARQSRTLPGALLEGLVGPPRAHVRERAEPALSQRIRLSCRLVRRVASEKPRRRHPQPARHLHDHLVTLRPGQLLRERHPGPDPLQEQGGGVPVARPPEQTCRAATLPGQHPRGLVTGLLMGPGDLQHPLRAVAIADRRDPCARPAGEERRGGLELPACEQLLDQVGQPLPPGDQLRIPPLVEPGRQRMPGDQRTRPTVIVRARPPGTARAGPRARHGAATRSGIVNSADGVWTCPVSTSPTQRGAPSPSRARRARIGSDQLP